MKTKISLTTLLSVIAFFMAIFAVIWSTAIRSGNIVSTLEAIEKNTEHMPQSHLLLQGIKKNTDELPMMAVCVSVIFEKTISEPIRIEIEKGANPKLLPACRKLIPNSIRNDIDRIAKVNIDKSAEDLAAILVRELDFSLLLNKSKEKNISFDKCLRNIGRYVANIITTSKTK